jgi:dephospho-CoA kinase
VLKVGLTGGVACGKSTIAAMFEQRGAHVIRADEIAHKLMEPGQSVYDAVVQRFGREILNTDGTISRPKLAELAFAGRIQELNALVHPGVVKFQDDWMIEVGRKDPHAITIVEAALLVEAGARSHFDKLITVTCGFEQKVERFGNRMKLAPETARAEVGRRMAAQLPDEKKAAVADFVIDNSGTLPEAEKQVEGIWRQLRAAVKNRSE